MKRICPNCGKEITYLQVSKQIEGTVEIPNIVEKKTERCELVVAIVVVDKPDIKWEHEEEPIYFYPCCLNEVDEETLKEWEILKERRGDL